MRVMSHALRCLVVSLACLAAVVSAANGGVLEVDVVFPRNETYAPTDSFPIIFGSIRSVDFTISSGGQPVDLVAATANTKTCPEELGTTIKVTGKHRSVSSTAWSGGDTCAVLDISSPTPTPSPCAIKIGSATAASISASWTARVCNVTFPPDYCPPKEDSASRRLAVAGVASLAAAFGAFGFLWL
ncbi:hypothetical protein F5144DRAFT_624221 [Chaetomium tenue]|uniref:Uncharacterized protein n=1 Tax=Chaetomium tenue TaxID=1854479 RepID=A0ACB7NVU2_9PEZI|nr:hypothetical protein F5144DRAFT_624221 [Chaetomium globosum]